MAEQSKLDDLELRSEYVQEVLGVVPRWIVRWGITVIFLALTLLMAASWIIHYPDVIPAHIVITTPNPPSSVIAQASGKLINTAVHDHQIVAVGDLLGMVENSADPKTVFELQSQLQRISGAADGRIVSFNTEFPENLQLGELQSYYSAFLKNYNEYKFFKQLDPLGREIEAVYVKLAQYKNLLEAQFNQKDILKQEVALTEKDYQRTRDLFQIKAIPIKLLEDKEKELLKIKRDLQEVQLQIAMTHVDMAELEKIRIQLEASKEQNRKLLELNLAESYKNLLSQLFIWEQKFVFRSPIAGKVTFFKFWSNHQSVSVGDEVMTIVPDQVQNIVGKVLMNLQNSGKVKIGQKVYICLDNYPYQEFGMIIGVVKSISLVPRNDNYAIEVDLPDNLKTTFNKVLDFRQEMQGRAEIVTEDLRLLERIFYQLRRILGRYSVPTS